VAIIDERRLMLRIVKRFQQDLQVRCWLAWVEHHRMAHEGLLGKTGRRVNWLLRLLGLGGGGGASSVGPKGRASPSPSRRRKPATLDDLSDDDDDDDDGFRERRRARRKRAKQRLARVEPEPAPPSRGMHASELPRMRAPSRMQTDFQYGFGEGPDGMIEDDFVLRVERFPGVEREYHRRRPLHSEPTVEQRLRARAGPAAPDRGWSGDPSASRSRR
jgi:hypothetical protein